MNAHLRGIRSGSRPAEGATRAVRRSSGTSLLSAFAYARWSFGGGDGRARLGVRATAAQASRLVFCGFPRKANRGEIDLELTAGASMFRLPSVAGFGGRGRKSGKSGGLRGFAHQEPVLEIVSNEKKLVDGPTVDEASSSAGQTGDGSQQGAAHRRPKDEKKVARVARDELERGTPKRRPPPEGIAEEPEES